MALTMIYAADGVESEAPSWEPEPFELPVVEPIAPLKRRDEANEPESPTSRVIVIDLC